MHVRGRQTMQATAKSSDTQTDATADADAPVDPDYVGKHRPSRMAVMRQRMSPGGKGHPATAK
jgi:hypothetical protein